MNINDLIPNYGELLDFSFDEIVISNREGTIIFANASVERHYGVQADYLVGKSTFDLERERVYYPAVIPLVLKEKRKLTLMQKTQLGIDIITTGNPIMDKNGDIEYVILNSRAVTEVSSFEKVFERTKEVIKRYADELNILRQQNLYTGDFIAKSKKMSTILETVSNLSNSDATVFLSGESGVGKDQLAKLIHQNSKRKDGPFIHINCGAIPEALIESELFGYEPGAFTGASKNGKRGLFELANCGTVYLDEVADLPLHLQVKLLQIIQERRLIRVGGSKLIDINVRIISATNKDLKKMVSENKFREDLYYRLYVIPIDIPPLRERKEDLYVLIHKLVNKHNESNQTHRQLSSNVIDLLLDYPWPGNIRELENVIERLMITTQADIISLDSVPSYIRGEQHHMGDRNRPLSKILEDVERKIILESYARLKSSYKVAKELGISQRTASRKIQKFSK